MRYILSITTIDQETYEVECKTKEDLDNNYNAVKKAIDIDFENIEFGNEQCFIRYKTICAVFKKIVPGGTKC